MDDGKLLLWMGKEYSLSGAARLTVGKWHFLAAAFDAQEFQIYADGNLVGRGKLDFGSVSRVLQMAPADFPPPVAAHFRGEIANPLPAAKGGLSLGFAAGMCRRKW